MKKSKCLTFVMSICILASAATLSAACFNFLPSDSNSETSSSVSGSVSASATNSDSSSEENFNSSSASDGDSSSASDGDSSSATTPNIPNRLEILSPEGEVTAYKENVVNYLKAGDGANVGKFTKSMKDAFSPVSIEWNSTWAAADAFKIEYSVNEDFSEAITTEVASTETKLEVYNLLKATTYYLRISALCGENVLDCAETTFTTTDLGPRVMNIGGIYNVRDLGGYLTTDGTRTKQGLIFRGGALSKSKDEAYTYVALNEDGKKYMRDTLNIQTDFDLRGIAENLGLTQSPIPNATLEYYGISGYLSAFSDKNGYRKVFSALADETKYPIYIHCTGGADRTGTVCFLVNALLGVNETALIQDYEFTSFSIYGTRNSKESTYDFARFVEKLKTDYEGTTLAEKTENYLFSIGVTENEIYNIKAIMLGKPLRTTVTAQAQFTKQKDETFQITLGNANNIGKIEKVVIADAEVAFSVQEKTILVANADMPEGLADGTINGSVIINGVTYPFSFEYDGKLRVAALAEENVTLNAECLSASGKTAIGYDGTIAELKITKLTEINHGGVFFTIGNYGVRFRGDLFRAAKFEDGYAEYSPRVQIDDAPPPSGVFNQSGGATLGLSVTIKDETTVTITVFINDEKVGSADVARVADEIASDDAVFTVSIEKRYVSELCTESTTTSQIDEIK